MVDGQEDDAAVAGFLAGLFGLDATPWAGHIRAEQRLRELDEQASSDIESTCRQVEDVAGKYGAQIPQQLPAAEIGLLRIRGSRATFFIGFHLLCRRDAEDG